MTGPFLEPAEWKVVFVSGLEILDSRFQQQEQLQQQAQLQATPWQSLYASRAPPSGLHATDEINYPLVIHLPTRTKKDLRVA